MASAENQNESRSDILKSGQDGQGTEHRSISILFVDLVGSTRLFQHRGDAVAREFVQRLHAMLTEQIDRFSGTLIKTIGDALMVIFARPKKALGCAMAMQRSLETYNLNAPPADRLHGHIGIHHGKAIIETGDIYGDAVNTASRIEQQAGTDEILTSLNTWNACLGLDTEVENLGDFQLKGIANQMALVKVLWQPREITAARAHQLQHQLIPELAKSIARKRCLLVVGGLTLGPGGGSLNRQVARELARELGVDERREKLIRNATLYEEENSREELLQIVTQQLHDRQDEQPELLQKLAQIPIDIILTTCLDQRLEQALRAAGKTVTIIFNLQDAITMAKNDNEVVLVKLFGDVSAPESLVLTEDDVANQLGRLKLAADELLAILATRHLLFVGFRWSDRSFKQLFDYLTSHTQSELLKANGISVKVAPGLKGTWQRRGLLLSQWDEIAFAETLKTSVQEQVEIQEEESIPQSDRMVQTSGFSKWKRPYKFLSFFGEEDQEIFFGRDEDAHKLFSLVVSHRLVVLHGASGTGKTSLLHAGLLPRLRQEGFDVVLRRALKTPEREIREAVGSLLHERKPSPEQEVSGDWAMDMLSADLHRFLKKYIEVLGNPLVIVLDQFEELFLRFPKKARQAFAEQLGGILKDRKLKVRFVLSLRHDFLSHWAEFKHRVPDVFHHDFRLENLSPDGMAEALEAPAKLAGLSYAPGLISQILTDLGTVGSEPPQLQIIGDRLYDELNEGEHEFGEKLYRGLGGAKGILGSYLERYIGTRAPAAKELAREVLKALVTSADTKGVVSVDAVTRETGRPKKLVERALSNLLEARLVRKLVGDEQDCYELCHEYLIDEIGRWMQEADRDLKKARELLRQEMINYDQFKLLMAPSRVAIIQAHGEKLALTKAEQALVQKSIGSHRRRKRWRTGLALVVVAGCLLFGFAIARHLRLDLCRGAEQRLAEVWNPKVKEDIHKSFLASGRSHAQDTFGRVAKVFDQYGRRWSSLRTQTCEATHIHGSQSEQMLDRKMRCLDQRLRQVQALTHLFATRVDEKMVDRAVQASLGVIGLEACTNNLLLNLAAAPPKDLATRKKVEAINKSIAQSRALSDIGKYTEGLELAQRALAQAKPSGYRPVEAVAWHAVGRLQNFLGKQQESEESMKQAGWLAESVGDDRLKMDAFLQLVSITGHGQARHQEAHAWLHRAQAVLKRLDSPPLLVSAWHRAKGSVYAATGKTKQAIEHFMQAVKPIEDSVGPDDIRLAYIFNDLGSAYLELGDLKQAQTYYQRALALIEKEVGPEHPDVGVLLNNLSNLVDEQGQVEEAISLNQRSLAILSKVLGPDHSYVGMSRSNLGSLLIKSGQNDQALSQLLQALRIQEKSLGPKHPDLAQTLTTLGQALLNRAEFQKARKRCQRALRIREEMFGKNHPSLTTCLSCLANIHSEKKEYGQALALHRRAQALCVQGMGAKHPRVAETLVNQGAVYQAMGNLAQAEKSYLGALAIFQQALGPNHARTVKVKTKLAQSAARNKKQQ